MKLTREAFLSQIDTLEGQLEESADRESTEILTATIEQLSQQLEVNRAQYDMKIQDLTEQITDRDSLMLANDIQNASERDHLQISLEAIELSLAEAKVCYLTRIFSFSTHWAILERGDYWFCPLKGLLRKY